MTHLTKRRALVVANDHYRGLRHFQGHVARDALELAHLLADPEFGGYVLSKATNLDFVAMREAIRSFFHNAQPDEHLLFYYSGHGEANADTPFMLVGTDTTEANPLATCLPARELYTFMRESPAAQLAAIVDCCYSDGLLAEIRERTNAPLPDGKTLDILCSGVDTFVRDRRSEFTFALMQGLRDGLGVGRKPFITLRDIAEYLATVRALSDNGLQRSFDHFGATGPSAPIARNANRNHAITQDVLSAVYSDDVGVRARALRELLNSLQTSTPERRQVIGNVVRRFYRTMPQIRAELDRIVPGEFRDVAHTTLNDWPREQHVLIAYNTRNLYWAHRAEAYLRGKGYDPRLYDLDMEERTDTRIVDPFVWLDRPRSALWIVDRELAVRFHLRYGELSAALDEAPLPISALHGAYWLEAPPTATAFDRCGFTGQSSEIEVEEFCGKMLGTASDPAAGAARPAGKLQRDAAAFFRVVDHHKFKLSERQKSGASQVGQVLPRVPNFLVLKKGAKFVLAICDANQSINPRALRLSYEPETDGRLATAAELKRLGFADGRVDPMFFDPSRKIHRIYIDAALFFQYLMFPATEVVLPNYEAGSDETRICAISSFVRAMLQMHGETKVVFANVVSVKKFNDPILLELFAQNHVFTRFAPTPSNSLHIGSLRTAVVSYLFSLGPQEQSKFHLRFDDTNVDEAEAEANAAIINKDLAWIGIPTARSYRQTSAHLNYRRVLELLEHSGFCRRADDGSIALDVEAASSNIAYWLDLIRGPRILHRPPAKSTNKKALDYSLTWPTSGGESDVRFKYKFAGAVDDLLHNSLVIRDIRQENSYFTARQSLILGCLRDCLAYPRSGYAKGMGKAVRQSLQDRVVNRADLRPFPFPCPPAYLHVARVCDGEGKPLSKRNLAPEHSVLFMRTNGTIFPETVLFWCLRSLGLKFVQSLGFASDDELLAAIARVGTAAFFAQRRGKVSTSQLLEAQHKDEIRLKSLSDIDNKVLKATSPIGLAAHAARIIAENGINRPAGLNQFIQRLYRCRTYFVGACDTSRIILTWARKQDSAEPERQTSAKPDVVMQVQALSPEHKCALRKRIIGHPEGPPVAALAEVLGHATFAKFYKEWQSE